LSSFFVGVVVVASFSFPVSRDDDDDDVVMDVDSFPKPSSSRVVVVVVVVVVAVEDSRNAAAETTGSNLCMVGNALAFGSSTTRLSRCVAMCRVPVKSREQFFPLSIIQGVADAL